MTKGHERRLKEAKEDDGLTQSERFLQAAKEAGADTDDPVAEALMGRMAKTKPDPKPKKAIKQGV